MVALMPSIFEQTLDGATRNLFELEVDCAQARRQGAGAGAHAYNAAPHPGLLRGKQSKLMNLNQDWLLKDHVTNREFVNWSIQISLVFATEDQMCSLGRHKKL